MEKKIKILFLFSILATVSFGKVERSSVRIKTGEAGSRKLVTLTNSDQIVNFLLDDGDGTIVDCHVYRRKELLLKIVKYEVMTLIDYNYVLTFKSNIKKCLQRVRFLKIVKYEVNNFS